MEVRCRSAAATTPIIGVKPTQLFDVIVLQKINLYPAGLSIRKKPVLGSMTTPTTLTDLINLSIHDAVRWEGKVRMTPKCRSSSLFPGGYFDSSGRRV